MATKLIALLISCISANLIVQSPASLKKQFPEGKIKAAYANYGFIPYGHTMVSKLAYVLMLCDILGWKSVLRPKDRQAL